jgi:hypothetical protein
MLVEMPNIQHARLGPGVEVAWVIAKTGRARQSARSGCEVRGDSVFTYKSMPYYFVSAIFS